MDAPGLFRIASWLHAQAGARRVRVSLDDDQNAQFATVLGERLPKGGWALVSFEDGGYMVCVSGEAAWTGQRRKVHGLATADEALARVRDALVPPSERAELSQEGFEHERITEVETLKPGS